MWRLRRGDVKIGYWILSIVDCRMENRFKNARMQEYRNAGMQEYGAFAGMTMFESTGGKVLQWNKDTI
jgi:hypothetical protein